MVWTGLDWTGHSEWSILNKRVVHFLWALGRWISRKTFWREVSPSITAQRNSQTVHQRAVVGTLWFLWKIHRFFQCLLTLPVCCCLLSESSPCSILGAWLDTRLYFISSDYIIVFFDECFVWTFFLLKVSVWIHFVTCLPM